MRSAPRDMLCAILYPDWLSELAKLLAERRAELFLRTSEHIALTGVAILIAAAIAFPLAFWIWDKPFWRTMAGNAASICQTVPSLALLAFLLPFLGLGFWPAVVTLTIYAVLPILRNTLSGMAEVNRDLIESGRVLGMNAWELLLYVQIPQSLPLLLAGLRTAVVFTVGTATLSAFIGAGGLGQFIITGLARNDAALLMLGAIPAAMLAIGLDLILGWMQEAARSWKEGEPRRSGVGGIRVTLASVVLVILAVVAIYPRIHGHGNRANGQAIRVGAKNFVEQMILGEILAQTIESKTHLPVDRRFGLASTSLIHEALADGRIDVYVEYSGTAERNILKLPPLPANSESSSEERLRQLYAERFKAAWLRPLGFSNSYALAVRSHGPLGEVGTITGLAAVSGRVVAGFNAEFIDRPDGYPALREAYGLRFAEMRTLDVGLIYPSLESGAVGVAGVFSTDGELASAENRVLADDRHVFPRYEAVPVARIETLERHPSVRAALDFLAGKINEATMRRLNAEVQTDRVEPAEVARRFLASLNR